MAKIERRELKGDFDEILKDLDQAINQSFSATLEDISNFEIDDCRCAVRVYERYSMFSGNRLSMNIVLLQKGDIIHLSAITAGGSNAVLFKLDTVGEESFLRTISAVVAKYSA